MKPRGRCFLGAGATLGVLNLGNQSWFVQQLLNLNLSGTLAPEIVNLSYLEILDFMWNDISESIPKEIGNIKTLKLLLLSENKLTRDLPEELGHLPVLDRIQIDENNITGSIPLSFANLNNTKHFHMNNKLPSGRLDAEEFGVQTLSCATLYCLVCWNWMWGHAYFTPFSFEATVFALF